MTVEDVDVMKCRCQVCTWHGTVGDCDKHHKWSYIICPKCGAPASTTPQQAPDSDVITPEEMEMKVVELKVVHLLGEAWNAFMQLPVSHSDEVNDFRFAIHAAQTIVLARVGQRYIDSWMI